MAQDRVGIIGPGRMGLAMLKHLKTHGFDVSVYDVNDEQLAKAAKPEAFRQTAREKSAKTATMSSWASGSSRKCTPA